MSPATKRARRRSVKRAICSSHSALTEVGETTSTRSTPFAAQQLAGGDRLDGLAEPHLVGQQCALAEGQMHRALPLIRQQRQLDQVEVGPSRFNCFQEFRP